MLVEGYARLTVSFRTGRVTNTGVCEEVMNAYALGIIYAFMTVVWHGSVKVTEPV